METLADLASHFELYAVCIECGRMERLDLPPMIERLGEAATVADVRARVRCRDCGRRTNDIRIVYVGPCGSARGFHYRDHSRDHELPQTYSGDQSPSSSVPSSVSPKPDMPT
jgi:ribosomal protein L37E